MASKASAVVQTRPLSIPTLGRALVAVVAAATLVMSSIVAGSAASGEGEPVKPRVGIFYFGNWNAEGTNSEWDKAITLYDSAYPEKKREPIDPREVSLPEAERVSPGWYNDLDPEVFAAQMNNIADAGIDFVGFPWFTSMAIPWCSEETGRCQEEEAGAERFLKLDKATRSRLQYYVEWESKWDISKIEDGSLSVEQIPQPHELKEWEAIVTYWVTNHLEDDRYLYEDGKPVVNIGSLYFLKRIAQWIYADDHLSEVEAMKRMLDDGEDLVRSLTKGRVKGVFWMAMDHAAPYVRYQAPQIGIDGLTAYGYHAALEHDGADEGDSSTSYEELIDYYATNWAWVRDNTQVGEDGATAMPYWVPVTAGWDPSPRVYRNTEKRILHEPSDHDNSYSTPSQWRTHLERAYQFVAQNPNRTQNTVMVCCWNEYEEGTIVEPTKLWGTKYLDALSQVFAQPPVGVETLDLGAAPTVSWQGGQARIKVTTNQAEWTGEITVLSPKQTDPGWNKDTTWHGFGPTGEIVLDIGRNDLRYDRVATIEVKAGAQIRTVRITQEGIPATSSKPAPGSFLEEGQWLTTADGKNELRSENEDYVLRMEKDGDVVLYKHKVPIWHLGTTGASRLEFTGGSLAALVQGERQLHIWHTGLDSAWYLVVRNNGQVVMVGEDFESDIVMWDGGTRVVTWAR